MYTIKFQTINKCPYRGTCQKCDWGIRMTNNQSSPFELITLLLLFISRIRIINNRINNQSENIIWAWRQYYFKIEVYGLIVPLVSFFFFQENWTRRVHVIDVQTLGGLKIFVYELKNKSPTLCFIQSIVYRYFYHRQDATFLVS